MKYFIPIFLFVFFSSNLAKAQETIKKKFKLPLIIEEVSGLHYSASGEFFWLNDSGGEPELYVTDGAGQLKKTIRLQDAKNKDWEELTGDDEGNIYIGDFGNNANKRDNLRIYRYNPKTEKTKKIKFTYPDQKAFPPEPAYRNFDMEGFFWMDDELHLFSKNKVGVGNYVTKHYSLSDKGSPQVATLRDSLALKDRVVTAAAISPDKKTVALLAYNYRKRKPIPYSVASIYFIRNFNGTDFLSGDVYKVKVPKFIVATQYESIDFIDDETVMIASEKTAFIKQKAKRIRVKEKFFLEKRLFSKKKLKD